MFENVISNIIANFITTFIGLILFSLLYLRNRRRLIRFFGVTSRTSSIQIYVSRLQITATTAFEPISVGYIGAGIIRIEYQGALLVRDLLRSQLLARIPPTLSSWLSNRSVTFLPLDPGIDVGPKDLAGISADNLILLGSSVYNIASNITTTVRTWGVETKSQSHAVHAGATASRSQNRAEGSAILGLTLNGCHPVLANRRCNTKQYLQNPVCCFEFKKNQVGERALYIKQGGLQGVEIPGRPNQELGIVQRINDKNRSVFICAGLGSSSTYGCIRYLVENWPKLLKIYGDSNFCVALAFPGQDRDSDTVVPAVVVYPPNFK